jgi:hypothetical protein
MIDKGMPELTSKAAAAVAAVLLCVSCDAVALISEALAKDERMTGRVGGAGKIED